MLYLISHQLHKDAGKKPYNDSKAWMEYSNSMDDIYNNINDYNPNRNRKILFDMIADMNTNKKFQSILKELFRYSYLVIYYFLVSKDVR